MELVPFTPTHYQDLIAWISSPELNYQWGGPVYDFPLTIEQISNHCEKPDIFPFLFLVEGEVAGFIEFRRASDTLCRICRVLILDPFKGRGLAKEMVSLLIKEAKLATNCSEFSLCVFDHNEAAKSLYQSLGFQVASSEKSSEKIFGRYWIALEMAAKF